MSYQISGGLFLALCLCALLPLLALLDSVNTRPLVMKRLYEQCFTFVLPAAAAAQSSL